MQQYLLLRRNLVYTGITRGKKLVVLIGQRKALAIAVRNNKTEQWFSGLLARLIAGPARSNFAENSFQIRQLLAGQHVVVVCSARLVASGAEQTDMIRLAD